MLNSIVSFSLRFRFIILVLAAVMLFYGAHVAMTAKLDVLPDFVPPEVVVQTEAPGLSPDQVETLVTRPLENAINGVAELDQLRSETIQGLSVITIVFKDGTDIKSARQAVAEKLTQVAMPAGISAPKMEPLTSSTMDLLSIGLVSEKLTPMELRTFADWTLKPRLLSVAGVAKCSAYGGESRQVQIQVHPAQLVAHGVALTDVLNAARSSTGVLGAGFIETKNQRILLQTDGQSLTPDAVGNVLLTTAAGGAAVRIRDVATVVEAGSPKAGDALIMGKPGVLLTMSSQYGANTMEATAGLEAALADFKPVLASEGITLYPALHRPATFIDASLHNIRHSLLLGAGLVAVILFLFLGHIRTAFISLISIPLSLLGAIIVLDRMGVSINTITLGGLAIAIGEVVDDAIIGIENIVRRMRENNTLPQPKSLFHVILHASLEVRIPVVYATFVVVLVFLPILTLSGLQGAFFAPLAKAYILAILTSLLVALTVTPALTMVFFAKPDKHDKAPRIQTWLRNGHGRILRFVASHPLGMGIAIVLFLLFAVTRLQYLGGEFLPEFREGHFVLGAVAAPGTSLAETMRIGKQISDDVLKIPEVVTIHEQIGRAELGEDTWGPERGEFHVDLKPGLSGRDMVKVEEELRAVLDNTKGISSEVATFVTDRISESISGETSPVVVNIFGDDLDVLDAKAAEVAAALGTVPGAADVAQKAPPGAPAMVMRLRPDRLTQLGLRPLETLEAIQTAYGGIVVTQLYRQSQTEDVAVILDPKSRTEPRDLGSLMLSTPTGTMVPLSAVADIFLTSSRSSILHDGARRRQTVTCGTTRPVQDFVADARKVLADKVKLPTGVYLEFAGAAQVQEAASRELFLHASVAVVGILLLLLIVLGHWRNLILILVNLPFALVGGVLALYISKRLGGQGTISMGSLVGFVTLFGVTTRNAIMLISHCEHLVTVDGLPWNLDTAIKGASERLVPILMTATVTSLGLLPLAIGSGEAGQEIEGPMALVILGGLATSVSLNLLVLPTLALRFGKFGLGANTPASKAELDALHPGATEPT